MFVGKRQPVSFLFRVYEPKTPLDKGKGLGRQVFPEAKPRRSLKAKPPEAEL